MVLLTQNKMLNAVKIMIQNLYQENVSLCHIWFIDVKENISFVIQSNNLIR